MALICVCPAWGPDPPAGRPSAPTSAAGRHRFCILGRLTAEGSHRPDDDDPDRANRAAAVTEEIPHVVHPADGRGSVARPGGEPVHPRLAEADSVCRTASLWTLLASRFASRSVAGRGLSGVAGPVEHGVGHEGVELRGLFPEGAVPGGVRDGELLGGAFRAVNHCCARTARPGVS